MKTYIILLGPPCSGKSSLGLELLKHGVYYISCSSILKKHSFNKELMNVGKLIDDDVVISAIKEEIAKATSDIVVFDGFPRTIYQLQSILNDGAIIKTVFFNINHLETRIKSFLRVECPKCGIGYVAGIFKTCPKCKKKLFRRKDEKFISKRLAEYKEKTIPIVEYLKSNNCGEIYTLRSILDLRRFFIVKKLIEEEH